MMSRTVADRDRQASYHRAETTSSKWTGGALAKTEVMQVTKLAEIKMGGYR
jgi:hypothetical protein